MRTSHEEKPTWPDELSAPTPPEVAQMLHAFWQTLARLPDYFVRGETLLLHRLISELRTTVIHMMLAANGIRYPIETQHLNLYLGESQRRALEKTIATPGGFPTPPIVPGLAAAPRASIGPAAYTAEYSADKAVVQEPSLSEASVAQAVALVVIYRWYAPQLTAKYDCTPPDKLEATTLAALHAAIPLWPRAITTE